MSLHFDAASSEDLTNTTAAITASPLTLSAWVNADQLPAAFGDEFNIIEITDGTTSDVWRIRLDDANDGQPQFIIGSAGTAVATATAAITAGTWHHVCGVAVSTTDRRCFLDGGNKGTNTTSKGDPTVTETAIGSRTSTNDFFDGKLAEIAIWNIALTDAQVLMLARRVSPLSIRPDALVHYWPLYGVGSPEPDYIGTLNMTLNNTPTIDDNPPVQPTWGYDYGWQGLFTVADANVSITSVVGSQDLAGVAGNMDLGIEAPTMVRIG